MKADYSYAMECRSKTVNDNLLLPSSTVAIGTVGILGNVYSLYHNFRRGKGFPRQLYIVLHFIDLSVCVIGLLKSVPDDNTIHLYCLANQISGIWTCIIGGAGLVVMSRPFYRVKKKLFWIISAILLALGLIPQVILIGLKPTDVTAQLQLYALRFQIYFGCTVGLVLVNLVLTVWTGIILISVLAENDLQRRNAAVTVVLLGVVFLLTNIIGVVAWVLYYLMSYFDENYVYTFFGTTVMLMVLNAQLNALVILRKHLMCCRGHHQQLH